MISDNNTSNEKKQKNPNQNKLVKKLKKGLEGNEGDNDMISEDTQGTYVNDVLIDLSREVIFEDDERTITMSDHRSYFRLPVINEVEEEENDSIGEEENIDEEEKAYQNKIHTMELKRNCLKDSETMTIKSVAKKYNVSVTSIWNWKKKENITRNICQDLLETRAMYWVKQQPKGTVTIHSFLDHLNIIETYEGFVPCIEWIEDFMKRNPKLNISIDK